MSLITKTKLGLSVVKAKIRPKKSASGTDLVVGKGRWSEEGHRGADGWWKRELELIVTGTTSCSSRVGPPTRRLRDLLPDGVAMMGEGEVGRG